MRVAINTSALESGHNLRGSGRYVRLLLDSLKKYTDVSVFPFTSIREISGTVHCIHYPFFDPFFLTLPAALHKPLVVTVHDLIPIVYHNHFPRGLRGSIKWQIQKRRLQKASAIITDSQSSKKDIVRTVNMPENNVFVIPLAPDPIFHPMKDNTIAKKYNLPKDFLLYVGDVNWNKNIPGLLLSMKEIDIPLVLVGKAFLNTALPETQKINEIIEREGLNNIIIKLGFVELSDLVSIYALAKATVCVSFSEGFGFPVLESMACGTPCVVSNTSSLREIGGPSVFVDPWDVADIKRGIQEVMKKDDKGKIRRWVKRFTWERVASKTVEVYSKIA
jgi:glycosyltransferase involved in cell wall biosynthesis